MKRVRSIFILVACIGVGLVIGALWKGGITPQPKVTKTDAEGDTERDLRSATIPELPLIAQFERDLQKTTGLARRLQWVRAVETAPLDLFPALAKLASGDEPALRMIAMRWIDLDPKQLLSFLSDASDRGLTDSLTEVLFQEWALREPKTLIAEMDTAPSFGPLRAWRVEAAEYITRSHPKLGLPLFERWSLGNFTPSMRGVLKWAAENPREAAEFALTIKSHYPATAAMKTIGEQWANIDPAAAINFAQAHETMLGRTLATSILTTWAELDLPRAAEWLAQADEHKRHDFSGPVVEQWAKDDPAAALVWCEENLSGSSLTKAAASVLRGAAETNPLGAADLVLSMEPSATRSAAAVEVATTLLPGGKGETRPPAAEAIQWLKSLDPNSTRRVLEDAVLYWPDSDPQSMANFLLTTPVDRVPSSVYLLVGRALGRNDPEGALQWANQLPEEARLAGGSDAFARWCQSQPENAMRWLSEIPANDARSSGYLKTALEYFAYEHNVAERVAALRLPDRKVALELAQSLELSPERRERLLSALRH